MTQPEGQDPSAQIGSQFMIQSLQERVGMLTQENVLVCAFNNQLIAQLKDLESQLDEERSSKESDGSGPPSPPTPEAAETGRAQRNGSVGGPSPADVARRARTRGGQ